MRILHLPSSYVPDSLGGTEIYLQQLVESLRQRGHDTEIAWHTGTTGLPAGSTALPPLPRATRRTLYAKSAGRDAPGFTELLTKRRPDLVHFHAFTLGAGLDHARAAMRLGIPYLITFHTPTMGCPRGTWLLDGYTPCDGSLDEQRCARCVLGQWGWSPGLARLLSRSPLPVAPDGPWTPHLAAPALLRGAFGSWREFFSGARAVVACAEFVAERLRKNGLDAARITVLRQALPGATRQRTLRMPQRMPGRPLRLGFFGRVTRVKGPDLAVEAVRRLRARGTDAVLELAGPIDASEEAWARETLLGAGAWVHHRGVLRGDGLRAWLETLDLIVLPSRWFETGPLTLLEAWDAGVPAIGTDLGGIAEFMNDQGLASCLFALEAPAAIVDAVERTLEARLPAPQVNIPGMMELTEKMLEIYAGCLKS